LGVLCAGRALPSGVLGPRACGAVLGPRCGTRMADLNGAAGDCTGRWASGTRPRPDRAMRHWTWRAFSAGGGCRLDRRGPDGRPGKRLVCSQLPRWVGKADPGLARNRRSALELEYRAGVMIRIPRAAEIGRCGTGPGGISQRAGAVGLVRRGPDGRPGKRPVCSQLPRWVGEADPGSCARPEISAGAGTTARG
jgi:hypothetical protein